MSVSSYSQKDFDLLADSNSSVNTSSLEPTRELKWNISSTTAQDIATAKANIDRYMCVGLLYCLQPAQWSLIFLIMIFPSFFHQDN